MTKATSRFLNFSCFLQKGKYKDQNLNLPFLGQNLQRHICPIKGKYIHARTSCILLGNEKFFKVLELDEGISLPHPQANSCE